MPDLEFQIPDLEGQIPDLDVPIPDLDQNPGIEIQIHITVF